MKKRIFSLFLMIAMLATSMIPVSFADTGESELYGEFADYRIFNTEISCPEIGIPIKITTYFKGDESVNSPFVFYVINHSGEYPGTESDVSIVSDFLNEGYIVLVLDYQNSPLAVSPYIEQSLQTLRLDVFNNGTYLNGLGYNTAQSYIVPSGYRLKKDVVYFDYAQSAEKGTLDWIVANWNMIGEGHSVVGDSWVKAETVYDIVMKDGTKLDADDLKLKMDIIYPSRPTAEAPVALLGSSNVIRSEVVAGENRYQNVGFLFRGYAWAVYDHAYQPFMLGENGWGHFQTGVSHFSTDFHTGTKTHTAAVRCVKYYADELGYSKEKVGTYGHSKSSWTSVLSNPTADMIPEQWRWGTPKGETYGEQPFLTYKDGTPISDDILCCYHSMGSGSARYDRIVTSSNVPTLIACGQGDADATPYWNKEKASYEKSGGEYIALDMTHVGHDFPYGDDTTFDFNHYDVFCKFFDYHLKGTAPEILYTSVVDGTLKEVVTTANPKTNPWTSRECETLFVQFSAAVTEWSFLKAVSLVDGDGNEVEGTWYTEGKGTKWIFDGELEEGEKYTLTIKDGVVADKNGVAVKNGLEQSFGLYASASFGKSTEGTLISVNGQNVGIVEGKTDYYRATEGLTAYPAVSVTTEDSKAEVEITDISDGYSVKVLNTNGVEENYNIHFVATAALNEYDLDTYLIPYWEGNVVYHESALFVGADGAPLMYEPEHILSVRSCDLKTEYIEGVDYKIEDGKIYRLPLGRIPYYSLDQFYFDSAAEASTGWAEELSDAAKIKYGADWVLCGGGAIFQGRSIHVTYTHSGNSSLYEPVATTKLTNVKAMLENGEDVSVVFFGDSITAGCNSTGREGVEPYTPFWSEMVRDYIKEKYSGTLTYSNTAVPGWFAHSVYSDTNANSETNNINAKILSHDPDLLVLGFGMNDGHSISSATYIANMKKMINATLAQNPDCEILVIATMLPNEENTPAKHQREYEAALVEMAAEYENVDVMHMTAVHDSILTDGEKRYFDISSNNVNHPNDFLIRVYAQTLLETLGLYD